MEFLVPRSINERAGKDDSTVALARLFRLLLFWGLGVICLSLSSEAFADDAEIGRALSLIASESHPDVTEGISLLGQTNTERSLAMLQALDEGGVVKDGGGSLYIQKDDGSLVHAGTAAPASPSGTTTRISLTNNSRRALQASLSRLQLTSSNKKLQRQAAQELADNPDPEMAQTIRRLAQDVSDPETKQALDLALAKLDLASNDPQRRLAAVRVIGASNDIGMVEKLKRLLQKNDSGAYGEPNPEVRAESKRALQSLQGRIFWINTIANTLYGLSLGSVLVLAALGLAITFGLMRVINMAHGEILMLGAYCTFFIRELFLESAPRLEDYYLLFAIPFAFAVTFAVGVVLERTVIRHLYGRPLETLLATWGLSLVLIQAIRLTFGAQNVTVANPSWLSGGFQLMPALVVPYSRIAVLLFTTCVVTFVGVLLRATSVGLKVRAVTQNRQTAAGLGIATNRVDMWTFGLGCGLAGLGGVALSQLGNVGPELGQQHIIDSFMVVVLGGVGNVLGTILAGMGLGIANKLLEPSVGAVLGKIMLLGLLILFIQWRPQGIFAPKGRAAEG